MRRALELKEGDQKGRKGGQGGLEGCEGVNPRRFRGASALAKDGRDGSREGGSEDL